MLPETTVREKAASQPEFFTSATYEHERETTTHYDRA